MKQTLPIGTTPTNEDCAGAGVPGYEKLAKREAQVYIKQLKRIFRKVPHGLTFRIEKRCYEKAGFNVSHDTYLTEVVIGYDDLREDQYAAAYKIQDNLPQVWDKIALDEIRTNGVYSDVHDSKWETFAVSASNDENMELRKAMDIIEEAGGFVMFEEGDPLAENLTETIGDDDLPELSHTEVASDVSAISTDQTLENNGYDSIYEAGHLFMDSVVPACCKHGCEVEPDGTCEHGNESILLALGLM